MPMNLNIAAGLIKIDHLKLMSVNAVDLNPVVMRNLSAALPYLPCGMGDRPAKVPGRALAGELCWREVDDCDAVIGLRIRGRVFLPGSSAW
jgi:hypothetical protein